ncbi:MAG: hypothetical protein JWO31_2991 [Phycisphaerales bacterium]|nr:hypothetical protein [Phycisphaerales bacterium]
MALIPMNIRPLHAAMVLALGAASCQNPNAASRPAAAGGRAGALARGDATKPATKSSPYDARGRKVTDAAAAANPTPPTPPTGEETAAAPAGGVAATQAAAGPSGPVSPAAPSELLATTADQPGYGEETYRVVSTPDEVIAVL